MSTFNQSILLGHLGADPEVVTTKAGEVSFVRCSVATTEKYRDDEGNLQEITDWNTVCFSNGIAKVAAKHLKKGSKIHVVGRLRTKSKIDEQGIKRFYTSVYVMSLKFMSYKQKENKKSDELEDLTEAPSFDGVAF